MLPVTLWLRRSLPWSPLHTLTKEARRSKHWKRFSRCLTAWMKRMKKMELSQARIDEDERMRGAVESGMFSSMLGACFAGKQLHRDALDWSALRVDQAPRPAIDRLNSLRPRPQQREPQRSTPRHYRNYLLKKPSISRYHSRKHLPKCRYRL